eukprot:SAG11_NODE_25041_length_364_cov_1.147170_2_plen_41_part_01
MDAALCSDNTISNPAVRTAWAVPFVNDRGIGHTGGQADGA